MPPNYGALRCNAWDEGLAPSCGDDGGVAVLEPEPWCAASFCYVDPASCDRPSDRSAYAWADPASHAPLGGLHYSYETCGNLNSYVESRHYEQLSGMHLRVAFPGDSGAGYTLYTIQHGVDEGKKDGSVWGFMAGVLKEGNVSWTPQEISIASRSQLFELGHHRVHVLDHSLHPFRVGGDGGQVGGRTERGVTHTGSTSGGERRSDACWSWRSGGSNGRSGGGCSHGRSGGREGSTRRSSSISHGRGSSRSRR